MMMRSTKLHTKCGLSLSVVISYEKNYKSIKNLEKEKIS